MNPKDYRNVERMSVVVDFLFTRPILSTRQVSDGLGIPFKTAGESIEKLVQADLLREITGYTRNRIYQADEIFKVLQGVDID